MQEISLSKKTGLLVAAAIAAMAMAFTMMFGVQAAYANDASSGLPVGASATDDSGLWVVKNVTTGDGVTLIGVTGANKTKKALTVPATVKVDGETYIVKVIGANAFKAAKKATKVTLGKNIQQIKAKAFKGSKVKTLVLKTTKLTKAKVKNSLKGSKVTKVKVKSGAKYVKKYKKIFKKANSGKKVTVSK